MILDCDKLETILLANWTKFLSYRELLLQLRDITNEHLQGQWVIQKVTLTRFQYMGDSFLIWVEYTAIRGLETANLTSEFHLTTKLTHIKTV